LFVFYINLFYYEINYYVQPYDQNQLMYSFQDLSLLFLDLLITLQLTDNLDNFPLLVRLHEQIFMGFLILKYLIIQTHRILLIPLYMISLQVWLFIMIRLIVIDY